MKKLLLLSALLLSTNVYASTLTCNWTTGSKVVTGHLIDILGDRIIYKANDGTIILTTLLNCRIEATIADQEEFLIFKRT